jgi:DNA-binding LytR/AlgR family response regulator
MTSALIAEDEPLLRAELGDMLAELWPELRICAAVGDGAAAVRALEEFTPEILFLDIQMPGLNGLEIAQQASGRAHVVFVTAFSDYAIAAFEHGALDYVVKPVSLARLVKTVARLKERLRSAPADLSRLPQLLEQVGANESRYLKWITVPRGRELRIVTTDEICYLRAQSKYTSVYTADAEYLLTSTLKTMREKLDPRSFWPIHRSFIVNVGAIETVHRSMRGSFEVQLKKRRERLPVSAAHAHAFKTM